MGHIEALVHHPEISLASITLYFSRLSHPPENTSPYNIPAPLMSSKHSDYGEAPESSSDGLPQGSFTLAHPDSFNYQDYPQGYRLLDYSQGYQPLEDYPQGYQLPDYPQSYQLQGYPTHGIGYDASNIEPSPALNSNQPVPSSTLAPTGYGLYSAPSGSWPNTLQFPVTVVRRRTKVCEQCRRAFTYPSDLERHKATHGEVECEKCHSIVEKSGLKNHIKSHDDEGVGANKTYQKKKAKG